MTLSIIVAMTQNYVIGKDGKVPWHLPDEAAYFRQTTLGHPVITGRKNYEAIGRPLPERLNVVITTQPNYQTADGVIVVHSLQEALALEAVKNAPEAFIIGGQQVYDEAIPLIDKLYLSIIHTSLMGDTFFNYRPEDWRMEWSQDHPADEKHVYSFTMQRLVRK
jgi:dihydrofolate reductase